jgi:hypothetical protein
MEDRRLRKDAAERERRAMSTLAVLRQRFEAPRLTVPSRARHLTYALVAVGVAAAACGLAVNPERTWPNLLLDTFYLLSLGLAGAFFVAIQHLSGAGWCAGLRRVPEAMTATLPAAALLMPLLFFGWPSLYPWSEAGAMHEDPALATKATYLSTPFVFARMVLVLGSWVALSLWMRRTSLRQDADASPIHHRRLVRYSAIFVVVFALSFSIAGVDWLMSLDPRWFSTIFAVYLFAGLFVAGLAFITLGTLALRARGDLRGVVNENHLHDLGKLLFAFSTFWAYIWLSQYLLIWYGNLPEEIPHYLRRTGDRWIGLFLLNLVLNWVVPFVMLLSRAGKRDPRVLAAVCLVLLAGHWLDLYLVIVPEVASGPAIGGLELLIAAGYAGLFLSLVMRALAQAPLVALNDPHLEESLRHHQ